MTKYISLIKLSVKQNWTENITHKNRLKPMGEGFSKYEEKILRTRL